MIIIRESSAEKAKSLIKKTKEKPIIVEGRDSEFNRKMLEHGKFDILLSPEKSGARDKLKQMDSGLNDISARFAKENKITIAIDISEIESLDKKDKAIRLARISQNLRLCRKSRTRIIALNYKDKLDALALLTSLGASSQQARDAVDKVI